MIKNKQRSLPSMIGRDLFNFDKVPVLLLIIALISSILVVTTTHTTRLLTAEHEQLLLEHEALDIEWRNLILEENVLGNRSRIERIATNQLKMQHINPYKENILVKNKE